MKKLLSIAIPTKNRQEYIIPLLNYFQTMDLSDMEIVIQDNSDDRKILNEYINVSSNEAIKYKYKEGDLSQMENSELAIGNCSGKYVCFLGDDDYISSYLVNFVYWMDNYGYDCCIFKPAFYIWPGLVDNNDKAELSISRFTGKVESVNVKKEYEKAISQGFLFMNKLPQVYQGVVLRERLEEIKNICGVYFPGPSPDMAVATSLSHVIKRMIYCDIPYITSGQSKKSASGLGILHKHKGELSKIRMLPSDIEKRWLPQIPQIWTGPTIYAQSSNEALKAFKDWKSLEKYNWNYFYAYFTISNPEYKEYLKSAMGNCEKYNSIIYRLYIVRAFMNKLFRFLKFRIQKKNGVIINNQVSDSFQAGKMTDGIIMKSYVNSKFGF